MTTKIFKIFQKFKFFTRVFKNVLEGFANTFYRIKIFFVVLPFFTFYVFRLEIIPTSLCKSNKKLMGSSRKRKKNCKQICKKVNILRKNIFNGLSKMVED